MLTLRIWGEVGFDCKCFNDFAPTITPSSYPPRSLTALMPKSQISHIYDFVRQRGSSNLLPFQLSTTWRIHGMQPWVRHLARLTPKLDPLVQLPTDRSGQACCRPRTTCIACEYEKSLGPLNDVATTCESRIELGRPSA